MKRVDWVLAAMAVGMGVCCLMLAATGLAPTSRFVSPDVRTTLLTWVPPLSLLCILALGAFLFLSSERVVAVFTRLVTLLALLAVAAVGAAVFIGLAAVKRPPAPAQGSAVASGTSQVSDAGGVQVKVTFDPKTDIGSDSISFTIVLDTHSVDLGQFDLRSLSRVTLQPGAELTDLAWQSKGEGSGHHVEGTLTARTAASTLGGARTIVLEMPGVASLEARRFEWKVDGK